MSGTSKLWYIWHDVYGIRVTDTSSLYFHFSFEMFTDVKSGYSANNFHLNVLRESHEFGNLTVCPQNKVYLTIRFTLNTWCRSFGVTFGFRGIGDGFLETIHGW